MKACVLSNLTTGPWPLTTAGGLAQLGEHLLCKQGVTGSIPVVSTRLGLHPVVTQVFAFLLPGHWLLATDP